MPAQARYPIYAHLDENIYQHLVRVAMNTSQSRGFIIAEALKLVSEGNIPIKHRKPVKQQKRGWFEPIDIFSNR